MDKQEVKANELRIGNWVNIGMKDVNGQVISISKNKIHIKIDEFHFVKIKTIDVKPIPLTEEWLLKFGGEIEGDGYDNVCIRFNENCRLSLHPSGFIMWTTSHAPMSWFEHVKHVHTLQNLYFSLTGEELISK